MVAEINLCSGNNSSVGISDNEDSRLGKVHDFISGYQVVRRLETEGMVQKGGEKCG